MQILSPIRQDFINNLLFLKTESLYNDLDDLKQRVDKYTLENAFLDNQRKNTFSTEDARLKTNKKTVSNSKEVDIAQDCRAISERAVKILADWSEIRDMTAQVQFAAVIIGKIDKLKRNSYIQSDEVKNKICTLLRNVIRLNVTDDIFTQEQIELLKKGFILLVTDDTKKENLLQLNRDLRKKNLITMPAWE